MDAERESKAVFLCCCVLIGPGGDENPCNEVTSGPDDPFCVECADRHPGALPPITVSQRLRSPS